MDGGNDGGGTVEELRVPGDQGNPESFGKRHINCVGALDQELGGELRGAAAQNLV